jgi:antitoxin (DNA-binding transcriptional repressor) of toxin-antitoxin stability system
MSEDRNPNPTDKVPEITLVQLNNHPRVYASLARQHSKGVVVTYHGEPLFRMVPLVPENDGVGSAIAGAVEDLTPSRVRFTPPKR